MELEPVRKGMESRRFSGRDAPRLVRMNWPGRRVTAVIDTGSGTQCRGDSVICQSEVPADRLVRTRNRGGEPLNYLV